MCYGHAGIGKTLSARRYAHWDETQNLLTDWGPRTEDDANVYAALAKSPNRLLHPQPYSDHPKRTSRRSSTRSVTRIDICIDAAPAHVGQGPTGRTQATLENYVELLIIDESERLNATALELLRDRYDRDNIALILIGMPGMEKQFSHYPQLYSRVGFAHQYRPLGKDELHFVLRPALDTLGQTLDPEDFTDAQAIAAIARITRGNFRLLERLFPQVERVLKINELDTITDDVIEAAASTLVIGIS